MKKEKRKLAKETGKLLWQAVLFIILILFLIALVRMIYLKW